MGKFGRGGGRAGGTGGAPMIYGGGKPRFLLFTLLGLVATLRLLSPQHHHLGRWKTLLLSWVRFSASFTETKTFDTYSMAFDVFVAGT